MSGRIRTLKPEWLDDELLGSTSSAARLLSAALMLLADDYGNGRASIATIAAEVWRFDLARDDGANAGHVFSMAREALAELERVGFVTLYCVKGQSYFAIRNWSKHQRVDKPGKPRVPGRLESSQEIPAKVPGTPANVLGTLAPDPDHDHDRDPERESARDSSGVHPVPTPDGVSLREYLRQGVVSGYQSIKQPAPHETKDLLWSGWARLDRWVSDKAALVDREPRDTGRHLIRCFLRSQVAQRKGYPVSFLVQNAAEYWRDDLPPRLTNAG